MKQTHKKKTLCTNHYYLYIVGNIFLTRGRETRTTDLCVVKCIKDENGKVLSDDAEINERSQRYFSKLLNGEVMEHFRSKERESRERRLDPQLCEPISKDETRETLKKITNGKV